MASEAEYAKRVLRPVWEAVLQGHIERHDEAMLITAVQQLRQRPWTEQLQALQVWIRERLKAWEVDQLGEDGQEEMVVVALTALAALRITHAVGPLPEMLSLAAASLEHRYLKLGVGEDLRRVVALSEEALVLMPDDPDYRHKLAAILDRQYGLTGSLEDLERSVNLLEQELPLRPRGADRTECVVSLARALSERYEHTGAADNLERAVDLLEKYLVTLPHVPDQIVCLDALARALSERYERTQATEDLERSVAIAGKVLEQSVATAEKELARVSNGPGRAFYLHALAECLSRRYERTEMLEDLEQSANHLEQALKITSDGPDRPIYLDALAKVLSERYTVTRVMEDLERSVDLLKESLERTPGGPVHATRLNNLALVLLARCELKRLTKEDKDEDLQYAVAYLEEALALTAGGPDRFERLNNLATALLFRYWSTGTMADLEQRTTLLEQALQEASIVHKPQVSYELAAILRKRYANQRAAAVVEQGTIALERLLETSSEQNEVAPLDQHGRLYDLQIAIALDLAAIADRTDDPMTATIQRQKAFEVAERAKGRRTAALLASRAASPTMTDEQLVEIENLKRNLAHLDQRLSDSNGAENTCRLLRGGPVSWLSERTPAIIDPDTIDFSPLLLGHAQAERSTSLSEEQRMALSERAKEVWQKLRHKLDALARSDPNYASVRGFALPRPISDIVDALPLNGALVYFYPLDEYLLIFVLQRNESDQTPQLDVAQAPFTRATLNKLVEDLYPDRERSPDQGQQPASCGILEGLLYRLAEALAPVLHLLLPVGNPTDPPTLVFVPTGPLHRIPLHALPWPKPAGIEPEKSNPLLDGYAVSYVTTADVLVLAQAKEAVAEGTVALAPGLAERDGGTEPAGTLAAASRVAGPASAYLREKANVDTLFDGSVTAHRQWVLLATHGRAGGREHARAGLLFHDREQNKGHDNGQNRDQQTGVWVPAAELLVRLHLDGVEHVGLAACSTHAEDAAPGDQLAGLLRALLYRGARSVQATLWPVRDDAAALVSVWTWEAVAAGERNKARALRAAVTRLRQCTGAEAEAALRGLAAYLPAGDGARGVLEGWADEVKKNSYPYEDPVIWAAFVLHGAPLLHQPAELE